MSDPECFGSRLGRFPANVKPLSQIVQGLLIHSDWLAEYSLKADKALSRETLPVADRLRQVLARDASPLDVSRPPEKRIPATCRDFALMLCSFLRCNGTPARLRCGFANYLGNNAWEDHWVCEYFDFETKKWQLADAQIDAVLKDRYEIDFDAARVPRSSFRTAGDVWLDCRAGGLDPLVCGHGTTVGLWFIAVNVARDHLALNGTETSLWDTWRAARDLRRSVMSIDPSKFDDLAERPEQKITQLEPFW